MKKKFLLLLAMAISAPIVAQATSLSVDMTTDNGFSLYLSTSDSLLGTLIGSGNNWMTTYSFSNVALTSGVTNYIHIVGADWGYLAGMIGDFTLSDADYVFGNGGQAMTTNLTDWSVYLDSFGGTPGVVTSVGQNGVAPWGLRSGIDVGATWIWTNAGRDLNVERYFSTAINPISTSAPEPAAVLLFGTGLAGLVGVTGIKKRKKD